MSVRKVEVERFSLTTSKPFESVVSALKAGIGQLDLAAFLQLGERTGGFGSARACSGVRLEIWRIRQKVCRIRYPRQTPAGIS
jgi:hypothetical protein